MGIELFRAFPEAGADDATAQAAVRSVHREIDERYGRQAVRRFIKADGAESKTELNEWRVGAILASAAVGGAIVELPH